jgi:methylated-DNA-protein-cysteine methyltransferase-like protein
MLTGKFHFATPTLMADLLAQEGLQIENDIILNFKNHVWQP